MGSVVLTGATSGSTTITPTDAVTVTVTLPSTGGTLQTSGAGFTTNGVAYASSTSALATGSALTFDGTNFGVGVAASSVIRTQIQGADQSTTKYALSVNDSVGNALYYIRNDGLSVWSTGATEQMRLNSTGLGIGTTSITTNQGKGLIVGNSSGGNISIGTNGQAGGSPSLFTDLSFRGYNNYETARIRGLDNSGTVAQGVLQFYTASLVGSDITERMRIDSSGNLLVGRTTTTTSLGGDTPIVFANGAFCSYAGAYNAQYSTDRINFNNANYYVLNSSTVGVKLVNGSTSWTTQSDERTKTDLVPIANGLQKVNTLRAVTGRYTKDEEGVSRAFLIAQDVKAVLPEAVDEDTDEAKTLGLRYTEVIPLLVAAIKDLKAELDTVKAELAALKG